MLEWTGWKLDEERERELAERIAVRAGPELGRRSVRSSAVIDLARWMRPVLAAAALLAALSVATLSRLDREPAAPTTAEALELPSALAEWIDRDNAPSMGELVTALGDNGE